MFLINCDNKGCGKTTQAKLDLGDNGVYCVECDKPITNVTSFTKAQLKNLKQTRKPKKEMYSSKCHVCSYESLPKLVSDKLCCAKCGVYLVKITKPFEILTKEAILSKGKDGAESK